MTFTDRITGETRRSFRLQDGLALNVQRKKQRKPSFISWKRRCGWCCTTGDEAFALEVQPVKRPAAEARWLGWWCDAGEVGEGFGASFGGVGGQNQSNQHLKGAKNKTKTKTNEYVKQIIQNLYFFLEYKVKSSLKWRNILSLLLIFPCLALLALTIARLLCSSLISIPAKAHTQTHLQAKIFTTHLLRNLFTLFTFHLTSLYSGCLYSQWKEFGSTHPSPGPPWLCASPWQTLVTTSACPRPSCSKAHT